MVTAPSRTSTSITVALPHDHLLSQTCRGDRCSKKLNSSQSERRLMETYKHIAEPARLSLSVSLATALPHLAARDRFPLAHSIATGACDDSGRAARASTSACAYGKCATSRTSIGNTVATANRAAA